MTPFYQWRIDTTAETQSRREEQKKKQFDVRSVARGASPTLPGGKSLTALDFETVLPKQFSGWPINAREVDPRLRAWNLEAGFRSLCRHTSLPDTLAEAIHHFQPVPGIGRQIR